MSVWSQYRPPFCSTAVTGWCLQWKHTVFSERYELSLYIIRKLIWVSRKAVPWAEAVSRRPLIAENRVPSQAWPRETCGGQSGSGAGFSPSTSFFPCQHHSTSAPYLSSPSFLLLFRWHCSPMLTFPSLMDFSQSALFFFTSLSN